MATTTVGRTKTTGKKPAPTTTERHPKSSVRLNADGTVTVRMPRALYTRMRCIVAVQASATATLNSDLARELGNEDRDWPEVRS